MSDMVLFNPGVSDNLPAHLQGIGLGVGTALMAAIGDSRNRIGAKGSRFRQIINGQEVGVWEENYLDVIVVGVVPSVSRIFYAGKFKQNGDNDPPACYSVDNVRPAEDVISKQSDICATCPQNVKGSRIGDDGHEGRACGFFRRMAIMLPGDPTLYVLDVKAQGIFGDSYPEVGRYSMNDYAKFLKARGVDASLLVTRLSFDTNVSVPKLLFKPERYINEDEANALREVSESGAIDEYLEINFKTIDLSKEQSSGVDEVPAAAEPEVQQAPARQAAPAAQVAKPTPAAQKPAQQATQAARPAQAAKPAATAQRPVQAAAKPAQPQARPAAQAAKPVTQAAKPVATAPKREPVTIDNGVSPQAAQAEVVEVGTDAELASLLDDLGL